MTLILDDPELDRLAHQLAEATGASVIEAVREAVTAKLATCDGRQKDPVAVEAALRRLQALPVLDNRTADEIIGYDEHGLPS